MGHIEREWRQFGCLSLRGRKRAKTIYSQIITSRIPDEAAGLGQRKQTRHNPALDTNSRLGPVPTERSTPALATKKSRETAELAPVRLPARTTARPVRPARRR